MLSSSRSLLPSHNHLLCGLSSLPQPPPPSHPSNTATSITTIQPTCRAPQLPPPHHHHERCAQSAAHGWSLAQCSPPLRYPHPPTSTHKARNHHLPTRLPGLCAKSRLRAGTELTLPYDGITEEDGVTQILQADATARVCRTLSSLLHTLLSLLHTHFISNSNRPTDV
jgi:hypothetical protein